MSPGSAAAGNAVLGRGLLERYPAEAARILEVRPLGEIVEFLGGEPAAVAAPVVERMIPEIGAAVVERMGDGAAEILTRFDPVRAAALLSRLDEEARSAVLARLSRPLRRELEDLLAYPPESAGRLMDPAVMAFPPDVTVRQVLDTLRRSGHRRVHDVYLVDEEGRLAGAVSLQDLALADLDERVGAVTRGAPLSVTAGATREEVVDLLRERRLVSVPVVDAEARLLGVIRHDVLIAAAEAEATSDVQAMVGAAREERALSPISFAVRKRLPWLEINLATAFLAASVVGLFEETIARFTALAVLLPVVAGQSGNTGAQALAVTMRGLALREVRLAQWLRVSRKEVGVAFLNGVAVALTTSLVVYLWNGSAGIALVIGTSMVISMTVAGLAGAGIPMLLTSLRQDPAQSSSIILTTVTDVVGFFSFLGIATALASML